MRVCDGSLSFQSLYLSALIINPRCGNILYYGEDSDLGGGEVYSLREGLATVARV